VPTPNLPATDSTAAHSEECSCRTSPTIRTARSRSSAGYPFIEPDMTTSFTKNVVSGHPGAIQVPPEAQHEHPSPPTHNHAEPGRAPLTCGDAIRSSQSAVHAACCDCVNLLTMSGVLNTGKCQSPPPSCPVNYDEPLEFSYRVRQQFKLSAVGASRMMHVQSPTERWQRRRVVYTELARRYIRVRSGVGELNMVAFWWSALGQILYRLARYVRHPGREAFYEVKWSFGGVLKVAKVRPHTYAEAANFG
jgi:hypothetical protein